MAKEKNKSSGESSAQEPPQEIKLIKVRANEPLSENGQFVPKGEIFEVPETRVASLGRLVEIVS